MGEPVKRRLCTICARGGSKGVLNKNVREIAGLPLIAHTIRQARDSGLFELIVVSSDSKEILEIARTHGAALAVERPSDLATDTAAKIPVIRHAAQAAEKHAGHEFDTYVDMDCTSPLRSIDDIRGAVELFESRGVRNVITGSPARRSPYFNLVEIGEDGVAHLAKTSSKPIARRQDAPKCFDMNASIYIWNREALMGEAKLFLSDTLLFEMPEDRSIDIDSELDFKIVDLLLKERGLHG